MIGQTISHYQILEKIGQGGMGEVFLAQDTSLDRKVALKFLAEDAQEDQNARKRLLREAKSAAALDHPFICKIYETGEAEGKAFIAMEYVGGRTLKDRLAHAPLSLKEALQAAAEIAEALESAHQPGLVHRDLKPSNIMLTIGGHIKIMDFGLAKQLSQPGSENSATTTLTNVNATPGTLAYMSPEQLRGKHVDTRSDVFSFGIVLYEILTGVHPFMKDSPTNTADAILHETPPPLTRYASQAPELLQYTVRKMLSKNPDERYQSIHEVRKNLGKLLSGVGETRWLGGFIPTWRLSTSLILLVGLFLSFMLLWSLGLLQLPIRTVRPSAELPEQKHVAVMPFSSVTPNSSEQVFSEGLVESIIDKFYRVEGDFSAPLWVVPSEDVIEGTARVGESRQILGVTLVVDGKIARENDIFRVTLNLHDASNWKILASETSDIPLANVTVFQDELVLKLVEMMDLQVLAPARERLAAGNTLSPQALESFLTGRGYLKRYPEEGNIDHAIQLLERAVQADPTYANAFAALGEAYWRKYQSSPDVQWMDKAKESAGKAIGLDPQVSIFHLILGRIHVSNGNVEQAIDAFQKARELGAFDASQELASAYEGMGRLKDAEHFYEIATTLRFDYWAAHRALGLFYSKQGRYSEAAAELEKVVTLRPDHLRGYNDLGVVYFYSGRRQEARQVFLRSLGIEENYRAYSNLGTLDFQEGRFADAAENFKKALELDDSDYLVWGNLASSYHQTGQESMAEVNYRIAVEKGERELEANPEDPYILCDLAGYWVELGESSRARSLLKKVQALHSGDPEVMIRLGEGFLHLQDVGNALHWIEKALEHGYPRELLRGIPELRSLLSNERFQSLLQGAAAKE